MKNQLLRRRMLWLPLGAVIAFVLGCSDPNSRETPGEKTEWSVLQGVEFSNREQPLTGPVFKIISGYEVLGVRGSRGQNIWVLLKPESPPFYKQIPGGRYDIQKQLINQLVMEERVGYTVEQVMISQLSEK